MEGIQLGALHYIYIAMIIVVIVTMCFKKDVVLPCAVGILLMGWVATGSPVQGVIVLFNALVASGTELWSTITIISLVVAMSAVMKQTNVDEVMLRPVKKFMVNETMAFFTLGIVMLLVSWFIWPSPAVALVGAIMLPVAMKAGLPAIWAAVAMNLFGHGMGLSSDFVIQAAPAIAGKAGGIENTSELMRAQLPLWIVMSIVTVGVAFFMMRKDVKQNKQEEADEEENKQEEVVQEKAKVSTVILAILVPVAIIIDIILMVVYELRGGDATALIGGTAIIVMIIIILSKFSLGEGLEKTTDYIRDGFKFGVKIFAPVIVIGGFFFMGGELATNILGAETLDKALNISGGASSGMILSDIGYFIANRVPVSKIAVVLMQTTIGAITGLDGSGFSGLPLIGSLGQTFANIVEGVDKAGLIGLGQLTTIWVGGGTIIPWAVIPVAAICGVEPQELVRKNFIPVVSGLAVTTIVAMIIL
jgi:hypothetical protein